MTIGERIKKLRGLTEIGQNALAFRADISQGYLSQVEGGNVKGISLVVACRISEVLGVTVYDLLGTAQTEVKVLPELASMLSKMPMARQKKLLDFIKAVK